MGMYCVFGISSDAAANTVIRTIGSHHDSKPSSNILLVGIGIPWLPKRDCLMHHLRIFMVIQSQFRYSNNKNRTNNFITKPSATISAYLSCLCGTFSTKINSDVSLV